MVNKALGYDVPPQAPSVLGWSSGEEMHIRTPLIRIIQC